MIHTPLNTENASNTSTKLTLFQYTMQQIQIILSDKVTKKNYGHCLLRCRSFVKLKVLGPLEFVLR